MKEIHITKSSGSVVSFGNKGCCSRLLRKQRRIRNMTSKNKGNLAFIVLHVPYLYQNAHTVKNFKNQEYFEMKV